MMSECTVVRNLQLLNGKGYELGAIHDLLFEDCIPGVAVGVVGLKVGGEEGEGGGGEAAGGDGRVEGVDTVGGGGGRGKGGEQR